jgi:L-lactate dehydrogenase complex protein LldE
MNLKVDIFIPCLIDQYYPDVAHNMIKVLERLGCDVQYNEDQTCCGRIAFEDGYWDHCKEVGEKFIMELQYERYIICPGAVCTATVKCQYPALFQNSSMHNQYKAVQKNMFEFSDFLVNVMNASDIGARYNAKAVMFDACKAVHELKIKSAPRLLLSKVRDLILIETPSTYSCCGMSGGLDRNNEKLAVDIGSKIVEDFMAVGADTIISTDMDCLMHFDSIIKKNNWPIKVAHLADVLASGWN